MFVDGRGGDNMEKETSKVNRLARQVPKPHGGISPLLTIGGRCVSFM